MVKLFVFPTNRNSGSDKFLLVTTLFFITLSLVLPCVYAFEGVGVYKDGKKVLSFDLAIPEEAALTSGTNRSLGEKGRQSYLVNEEVFP
jgi:hypothetical protein